MKRFLLHTTICLLVFLAPQCSHRRNTTVWEDPTMWYESTRKVNDGYADLFYLVSTDVIHAENPDGTVSYIASNTEEEKALLEEEMSFVENNVFSDSLNFFAPYYHQLTLEAVELGDSVYRHMASDVAKEAYESFRYYMDNLNLGRPVILAGFSQGALLVKEIVKMMTQEEFSRVVASYSLGWGVNDADVRTGRVVPAVGSDDTGVCISFNTVSDTSCIWPIVMDDASYSINPVNWSTEGQSAEFTYEGKTLTARLDTGTNAIVVEGFEETELGFRPPWPSGCLHHYEILFYNDFLNRNALRRVNHFRKDER